MVDTNPAFLGNPRLLSAAAPGTGLTTTRAHIAIPPGTKFLTIAPNTFSTAVVAKYALNPYLKVLVTMDAMVTDPANYSEHVQDGSTGVATLSSLPTLANGGAIYIGAYDKFSGFYVDSTTADGGAGTMAVTYWDGNSWENITPTDNTSNWGTDGVVNWTVPSDWAKVTLRKALALTAPRAHTGGPELYWVRVATSAALDSDTTVTALYAINRYADATSGLIAGQEVTVKVDRARNGGNLQALTDAGTANLLVTGYY